MHKKISIDISFLENNNIYFIGDIHGKINEAKRVIEEKNKNDYYVFLGDLINKGEDSKAVLDLLLNQERCFFVFGNHESAFINLIMLIEDNMMEKGILREALKLKVKEIEGIPEYIDEIIISMKMQWLKNVSLIELIEIKEKILSIFSVYITINIKNGDDNLKIGCCHAEVPDMDWNKTQESDPRSMWSFDEFNRESQNQKTVKNVDFTIHGHVPVKDVTIKKNRFYIDTASFSKEGCLSKLNINKIIKFIK